MHHATYFNHFESGTQASDMTQFHKISVTKCNHRETTEQQLGFTWLDGPNTRNR